MQGVVEQHLETAADRQRLCHRLGPERQVERAGVDEQVPHAAIGEVGAYDADPRNLDRHVLNSEVGRHVEQTHPGEPAVRAPVEPDGHDPGGCLEHEALGRALAGQRARGGEGVGEADGAVPAHIEINVGGDEKRPVVGDARGDGHQPDHRRVATWLMQEERPERVMATPEIVALLGDSAAGQRRHAAEDDARRVARSVRVDDREGSVEREHHHQSPESAAAITGQISRKMVPMSPSVSALARAASLARMAS